MVKEKSAADVEIERIRAGLKKTQVICDLVRWISGCFCFTIVVGIIAWAMVRMTDKPSWLVFALALIAAIAPPTYIAWKISVSVRRKSEDIEVSNGLERPGVGVES